MDRDLGAPKKSQESGPVCVTLARARPGPCANRFADETILQSLHQTTRHAAPSKAPDKDGTFNKEFHR
jgi:hypothetical protein